MAKKILFAFAGSGVTAKQINDTYESNEEFSDNVVRVYFNGCQDSTIGGGIVATGYLSPNLDVVGRGIRSCFNKNGNLSLTSLKRKFGKSIIIEGEESKETVEVESINLLGFSRGAVTTFAVTRHLNDIDKPIRFFAEDPVPGNSKASAKKKKL